MSVHRYRRRSPSEADLDQHVPSGTTIVNFGPETVDLDLNNDSFKPDLDAYMDKRQFEFFETDPVLPGLTTIGGAVPVATQGFSDDDTLDVVIGQLSFAGHIIACVSVFNTVSQAQTSYTVTLGVSPTGVAEDILQVDSDVPADTVELSVLAVGGNVVLRFSGSGVGNQISIRFTTQTIPRI